MVCTVNSIDSNITGLSIAEELCPKELPVTPIWYAQEPNSYTDMGADIKTVARETINALRQDLRGTVTDVDSAGGFNMDVTQDNMNRLFQGFFFNNAYEKYNLLPLNGTANPALTVATTGIFNVTSTLATSIFAGDLVKTTGFADSANNALGLVQVVTTTQLDTDIATVTDASASASANIRVVGFQFASGDLVATLGTGTLILTSTVKTMTAFGLKVGEWIYIGGSAVSSAFSFANGTGYARVKSVSATQIILDKSTGLITADAGTGKTVRIFFGTYYRNGTTLAEIIFRTYQLELSLGNDANGVQSEIVIGSYPNKFSLKVPTGSKLSADLTFVSLDTETRTGLQGLKSGTRVVALGQEAYNTSTDMVRMKMSLVSASLSPTDLFSFLSEFNIDIDNGIKINKAVGVAGGFSSSTGNFKISGSVTAYFQTVSAIQAVRSNSDVTVDAIFAKHNGGFVYDIPLMGVGGGKPNIQKDSPITLPITQNAAMNVAGYTLGYCNLHYLPDVAMPVAQ